MKKYRHFISIVFTLLLVLGPLEVRPAFACDMMETTYQSECCCNNDKELRCEGVDCENLNQGFTGICCDQLVEISVDNTDNQPTAVISNLTKPDTDNVPITGPPPSYIEFSSFDTSNTFHDGDTPPVYSYVKIYLTTQRLRL